LEIKANYLLNVLFTLFVVAGIVGFVHWIRAGPVTGPRASYHIVFRGSVGGLTKGSEVLFNGMQVGEVAAVRLDERDPRQVVATVSIDAGVPIGNDTFVGLEFGTITGVAWIELRGSDPMPAPLPKAADGVPTMTAEETPCSVCPGRRVRSFPSSTRCWPRIPRGRSASSGVYGWP
jgi:phospholipid/cholesterol/gamma-HCH transport system substrate-binding protein